MLIAVGAMVVRPRLLKKLIEISAEDGSWGTLQLSHVVPTNTFTGHTIQKMKRLYLWDRMHVRYKRFSNTEDSL